MTAPAVIETPTTETAPESVESIIASITQEAVSSTVAESNAGEDRPRGPDGRFLPTTTPVEGETVAAAAPAVAGDAPVVEGEAAAAPVPVVLPDGIVAVPKIEGRELATQFTLADKDGELEIPDLTINYTANGKPRADSLDKVVKLAQMGVYNEERQQRADAVERTAREAKEQNQQLFARLQQMEAERLALLSDDTAYLTARAKYEAENTPEARAAAERERSELVSEELAFTRAANAGQQFLASELQPAVTQIAAALPLVTDEEIGAKILLVTDRFRVHTSFGSIIPPQYYDQVRAAIVQDVTPWAIAVNEQRGDARTQQTSRASADAAKAKETEKAQAAQKAAEARASQLQIDAQKSKSLIGRSTKPAGAPAGGQRETPKPRPITNLDDAQSAALDETFAAIGMNRPRGS